MGAGLPLLGITADFVSGTPELDSTGEWWFWIPVQSLHSKNFS